MSVTYNTGGWLMLDESHPQGNVGVTDDGVLFLDADGRAGIFLAISDEQKDRLIRALLHSMGRTEYP